MNFLINTYKSKIGGQLTADFLIENAKGSVRCALIDFCVSIVFAIIYGAALGNVIGSILY